MFPEYQQKHFAKRLPCMAGMCAKKAAIPFCTLFPLHVKIRGQGQAAAKGTAKESWGFTKHEKIKRHENREKNKELKKC